MGNKVAAPTSSAAVHSMARPASKLFGSSFGAAEPAFARVVTSGMTIDFAICLKPSPQPIASACSNRAHSPHRGGDAASENLSRAAAAFARARR